MDGKWTVCTFCRAVVKWARQPVNRVRIRYIRTSTGLKSLLDHSLRIRIEPLSCNQMNNKIVVKIWAYNKLTMKAYPDESTLTEHDRHFLIRLRERVSNAFLRENDEWSIKVNSQPWQVCMPPQCASLTCDGKVVDVALACLDRALGYVGRSVGPLALQLPYSMPGIKTCFIFYFIFQKWSWINQHLLQGV